MTAHQTNAYLLQAREAGIAETPDPGAGLVIRPGRRDRSYCVLTAGAGATTRVLSDPDDHPLDQEITLIAVGITGANTITITGLQGSVPTHVFSANGTSIFRVTLEGTTKIWLRIGPGAESALPPDGDYGDITVSGSGLVWTIDAGVVSYAKIQDVSATDRILGRVSAGAGDIEEIVFTDQIQQLADDVSFAAMRTTLGLGTIATQNADNVTITGGSITGLTDFSSKAVRVLNPDGTDPGVHLRPSGNGTDPFNIFIGDTAGVATTVGEGNVGIGENALNDLTSGNNNVAVGNNAAPLLTTSVRNAVVGNNSLIGITSGSNDNAVVGPNNLTSGTTLGRNVAIGERVAQSLITGVGNTLAGSIVGYSLINGYSNSLFGQNAGYGLQYGNYNEAFGYYAGFTDANFSSSASNQVNLAGIIMVSSTGVVLPSSKYKPAYGVSTYASGTAYTLTATAAALDFGTTDPVITLAQKGTYKVSGWAVVEYVGATFAANQTVTLKLRRTNNTAADLSNGSAVFTLQIVTTLTGTAAIIYWEASDYTTTNTNDSITIFGQLSATPSAGSVTTSQAHIKATRIS